MIIASVVLSFLLCKFCITKRKMCHMRRRQRMNQMRNEEIHVQDQFAYPYAQPVNQHAYPPTNLRSTPPNNISKWADPLNPEICKDLSKDKLLLLKSEEEFTKVS